MFAGLFTSLVLSACALSLSEQTAGPVNRCDGDDDCGTGARCVSTSIERMCVATETSLGRVLLEVRTTSDTLETGSYVFEDELTLEGVAELGSVSDVTLDLPATVTLRGRLRHAEPPPKEGASSDCIASDGSEPVEIALRRVSPLPSSVVSQSARSTPILDTTGRALTHEFSLDVVPGRYDVVITGAQNQNR